MTQLEEIFSDSNNNAYHQKMIYRLKQKKPISEILVDSSLHFKLCVIMCIMCFSLLEDECVELSLIDETFCENCSSAQFPFWGMCFLEKIYEKNAKKKSNFENFESTPFSKSGTMPLTDIAFTQWPLQLHLMIHMSRAGHSRVVGDQRSGWRSGSRGGR